jgi:pimeloyl-ACP methyl ester carboxylesterase
MEFGRLEGGMSMQKITKGYVDTPWGQVHYRTTGDLTAGMPIVMLHQTASSSEMFEGLMRELSDEYVIFAPDTPGFGGSFHPHEKGSIPFYAKVLHAALNALEVERAWLFGHHTGATIAVQMMHDRPSFAPKLALSGPCLLSEQAAHDLAQSTQPMELRPDGSHFAQVWDRINKKDPGAPLALKYREAVLTLVAGTRWSEGYHAVFEHWADFGRQLHVLAVPTLVFAGDKDTVFHLLEPSYRALKDGHKAVLHGQSTYSCDRAPKEVAQLLRDFFQ